MAIDLYKQLSCINCYHYFNTSCQKRENPFFFVDEDFKCEWYKHFNSQIINKNEKFRNIKR